MAGVGPLEAHTGRSAVSRRAGRRVPFVSLVEAGVVQRGAELTDSQRRWTARVRADGTIAIGDDAASIHRIGARVQGLDACNGWTFWHVGTGEAVTPIDDLRGTIRDRLGGVEA